MTARKAQELRDTLCAAGAAITPWGCLFEPLYPLIAGVIAAFSGSIPHTLSNKCPHCGKQSGIDAGEFSSSAESASTDKYPGSPWLLPACSGVEPAGGGHRGSKEQDRPKRSVLPCSLKERAPWPLFVFLF